MKNLIALVSFLIAVPLFAQEPEYSFDQNQYGPKAPLVKKTPMEIRMIKTGEILDTEYEDGYEIKDQTFDEFLTTIEDSGLNVKRRDALTQEQLDKKINLKVVGYTTLEDVIESVLDYVNEEEIGDSGEVNYFVLKGILHFSSNADFDEHLTIRFYNISHLTMGRPHYLNAPEVSLERKEKDEEEIEERFFSRPGRRADPIRNRAELQEQLVNMLKDYQPDSWQENGGRGTISVYGDKLMIRQTLRVHERIGGRWW